MRIGLIWGFVGVASFSLTLPATRVAVAVGLLPLATVGQVQLLQPFLTILASAWLLGERIAAATYVAAALVIVSIAVLRRTRRRMGRASAIRGLVAILRRRRGNAAWR